jgi:actin-binding protein anillin
MQDGRGNKLRLTPKKQKSESRMVTPSVLSPGGPSAVRSPAFKMSGYVVFSLKELRRTQFTLNKVSYCDLIEHLLSATTLSPVVFCSKFLFFFAI